MFKCVFSFSIRSMDSCGAYLDLAFAVDPINKDFDPNVPPTTGEEYIQRVMLEASKCETVMSQPVDSSRINKQTVYIDMDTPDTPVVTPSKQWQKDQVAEFSEVRQKLTRMKHTEPKSCIPIPVATDEEGWHELCFGNKIESSEEESSFEGTSPYLSIMLSMTQPVILQVLEYQVEWLQSKSTLSKQQGQWLYALLACLELPLFPETCSLLRTLAKTCSRIRGNLKSVEDPAMAPLMLLICLVANYFRQMDLADS